MVVADEIHTATHFCAWNIVIPTAKCPIASAFAAKLYQVHHSCRSWRIQTSYWNIVMSGRVFPQHFSKSLLRNNIMLVEYALLMIQSLGEDSPLQLRCWSTRTNESLSLWCILWTCVFGRRIVQTGRILLAIGLDGI